MRICLYLLSANQTTFIIVSHDFLLICITSFPTAPNFTSVNVGFVNNSNSVYQILKAEMKEHYLAWFYNFILSSLFFYIIF